MVAAAGNSQIPQTPIGSIVQPPAARELRQEYVYDQAAFQRRQENHDNEPHLFIQPKQLFEDDSD